VVAVEGLTLVVEEAAAEGRSCNSLHRVLAAHVQGFLGSLNMDDLLEGSDCHNDVEKGSFGLAHLSTVGEAVALVDNRIRIHIHIQQRHFLRTLLDPGRVLTSK